MDWILFAQDAQVQALAWAPAVMNLAKDAGFAGLGWYLVVKHIPEIEKRHREERKIVQERFDNRLTKMEESQEHLTNAMNELSQAIRDMK